MIVFVIVIMMCVCVCDCDGDVMVVLCVHACLVAWCAGLWGRHVQLSGHELVVVAVQRDGERGVGAACCGMRDVCGAACMDVHVSVSCECVRAYARSVGRFVVVVVGLLCDAMSWSMVYGCAQAIANVGVFGNGDGSPIANVSARSPSVQMCTHMEAAQSMREKMRMGVVCRG